MNTEQNTQLARSFFERFDANDIAGVLDLLADDASYWLAGKPGQLPGVGTLTRSPKVTRWHSKWCRMAC
jgi:ketosteroid isomerase-like protein